MISGLPRNIATFFGAWRRGRAAPASTFVTTFRVWPLDVGIATLKSDRYLQMVEAAQLDYIMRTGNLARGVRQGIGFVNASLQMQFHAPVRIWDRVEVHTTAAGADERFVWFKHEFFVREKPAACVWVKMKFKQGRRTVPPVEMLGALPPPLNTGV